MSKGSEKVQNAELVDNLGQVEQELVNILKLLNQEFKNSKGTQKRELEIALNVLEPFVEQFRKDKNSLTNNSYMEGFKNFTMTQIESLNQKLGDPASRVKNSVVLNAVKEVLVNVYDFLKTSLTGMLDIAVKTGEFAKSIVNLGTTLTSGKKQELSKSQDADTLLANQKEVPTLLKNLDTIEKGFSKAQELLSEVVKNSNTEQKPKFETALAALEPIVKSFEQTKNKISSEKMDFGKMMDKLADSSTVLGGIQNWGGRQVEALNTKLGVAAKNNPPLNAVIDVVKTGGDLLKTTVTNTLDKAIKVGKIAESIVKLGVEVKNLVHPTINTGRRL